MRDVGEVGEVRGRDRAGGGLKRGSPERSAQLVRFVTCQGRKGLVGYGGGSSPEKFGAVLVAGDETHVEGPEFARKVVAHVFD